MGSVALRCTDGSTSTLRTAKRGGVQVVEAKSATRKVLFLQEQSLHATVGEKQLQVEFLEKWIIMASGA